ASRRYEDFLDREPRVGSWWEENAPQLVVDDPTNPAIEQGGIAGLTNTVTSAPLPNVAGSVTGAVTGGGGPLPGQEQQWFMQLVGNRPWNQQTFNELAPTLQQYGFKITPPNAAGEQTKIQLPNGQWVRVGFGEGHPVWVPQAAGGGGSAPLSFGDFAQGPGAIPPPYASQPYGGPAYQPPRLPTPLQTPYTAPTWSGSFTAPTEAQVEATPGYATRLAAGQNVLERSAAAKGSILSGGTQKALSRYGQEYGSNEYGNAYARALGEYQQKYGEFLGGANLGLQGRQQQTNEYG